MGSLNILFFVSIAIIILSAVIGYKKGLLNTLYGIVAIVFVVVFEYLFEPIIRKLLEKYTNLSVGVEEIVRQYVGARYEPDSFMYGALTSSDTMGRLTESFAKGLSLMMTFFLAVVIAVLVGIVINKIGKVNAWKTSNKVLGSIFGILKGIVYVWVLLYVGELIAFSRLGNGIIEQTNANTVLSIINEFNLLKIFLN